MWRPLPAASRLATALAVVGAWWRRCRGRLAGVEPGAPTLERPWRRTWDHLPKRSAGADFTRADYAAARTRAREVARATLGDTLWAQLQRQGYLDVPSTLQLGLTAFTAAVLGGIGNLPGAVLGALMIGLVEAFNNELTWHSPGGNWTESIVFSILILVLVFRPEGLLGERTPEGA